MAESALPPDDAQDPPDDPERSGADRVIVQHLAGSRRGQIDDLAAGGRIRFGRHPDCEVRFDARRDIDASSRHAELTRDAGRYRLRDVGSSNGTFVAGEQVAEVAIDRGQPVVVDFGEGGPRLRIFIGDPGELPSLPAMVDESERLATEFRLVFALAIGAVVAASVVAWIALV